MQKAVFPKLWTFLWEGGRGCAAATYHNLLPLLSRLPAEPPKQHSLYQQFIANVHTGSVVVVAIAAAVVVMVIVVFVKFMTTSVFFLFQLALYVIVCRRIDIAV